MIHFFVMFNKQRKVRFERWFETPNCEKKRMVDGLISEILMRNKKVCSFLEYQSRKVVYKRFASLFFAVGIDDDDNELLYLEVIHRYVEILDQYFGTVCELDVVYNFEKANFLFDEYILGGELLESSKLEVIRAARVQDRLQERETKKSLFRNNRVC